MNQNPYERGRDVRSTPTPRSAPQSTGSNEPSPFAVHGDPTRRDQPGKSDTGPRRNRVMWIRPTDLPTQLVGSKPILAGIDLHAALVQKLWRQPAKAVEAIRTRSDRSNEPPEPGATRTPSPRAPRLSDNDGMDRP